MFKSLVAAVAASLVLVPGAVSASPSVAAARADDYPPGVVLNPGQIPRGADTPLLHMAQEVIVDGATRVPVDGEATVWLLGRVGGDYLVQTAGASFRRYTVQLVHPDGSRQVLQRFDGRTSVSVSADGTRLALVTMDRPSTRIRVVETLTGTLVRQRTFGSLGAEVADYGVHRMVVTGVDSRTYWWNPETNRLRLLVPHPAWADIAADRLVVRVPKAGSPYEECQQTVVLSQPSVVLWRSCRDLPYRFSPDGRRMLTIPILTDGIGASLVQVRRMHGGLVQTFRPPMYFGFTEWESNHQVLLQPVGKKYVAAVRCDLTAQCERASRLFRSFGGTDPLTTMRWSFPE
ncbi:MAG TPA: hypothetical protein PLP61_13025 [Nocardioides sp.]|uniref:hypothetical protein n=1 Tax=Nocardioides sp. TaxID=35761 RepID=UPI002C0CE58B|nr:hypothetical protein [Nocardioides sp.]HQR27955.1 hypothetical protein [Nocardioides sp.]